MPGGKVIATAVIVLVLAFASVTWYYQTANGTSVINLLVFDGMIGLVALILAAGLWTSPTIGRTTKLTFASAVLLFILAVFVTPFTSPFTDLVSYFLLFGGLAATIAGIFMRTGS